MHGKGKMAVAKIHPLLTLQDMLSTTTSWKNMSSTMCWPIEPRLPVDVVARYMYTCIHAYWHDVCVCMCVCVCVCVYASLYQ